MKKVVTIILLIFFFTQTASACVLMGHIVQVHCTDGTVATVSASGASLAHVQEEVSLACLNIDITTKQFDMYNQAYLNNHWHDKQLVIQTIDENVLNRLNARNENMLDCEQYHVILGEDTMMYYASVKSTCRQMSHRSYLDPSGYSCGEPKFGFSPVMFIWYSLNALTMTGLFMVGTPLAACMIIAFAFSEDNKWVKPLGLSLGLFAGILLFVEFVLSFVF